MGACSRLCGALSGMYNPDGSIPRTGRFPLRKQKSKLFSRFFFMIRIADSLVNLWDDPYSCSEK